MLNLQSVNDQCAFQGSNVHNELNGRLGLFTDCIEGQTGGLNHLTYLRYGSHWKVDAG